jgi:hypothetical protein
MLSSIMDRPRGGRPVVCRAAVTGKRKGHQRKVAQGLQGSSRTGSKKGRLDWGNLRANARDIEAAVEPPGGNSRAAAILNHLRALPRGGGVVSLSPPNRSRKASACTGSAKQNRT